MNNNLLKLAIAFCITFVAIQIIIAIIFAITHR